MPSFSRTRPFRLAGSLDGWRIVLAALCLATAAAASTHSDPTASPLPSRTDRPSSRPSEILLWPRGAPGAVGDTEADRPSLLHFAPPAAVANGSAAVVCPGGAYGMLALEKEGIEVARWLNGLGMHAFVLRYRHAPRYRHPAPVADAKRAMRVVRARASRLGLDPLRIGMVGFSAGGHLAATVAVRYDGGRADGVDHVDAFPCQPAFTVLVYPVITMDEAFTHRASRRNLLGGGPDPALVALLSNERHVTTASPPAFLVHSRTDPVVPFRNSEAYLEACRKAGVPAELKAYGHGTHAFGLARGAGGREPSEWPSHCARWLEKIGVLGKGPAGAGVRGGGTPAPEGP